MLAESKRHKMKAEKISDLVSAKRAGGGVKRNQGFSSPATYTVVCAQRWRETTTGQRLCARKETTPKTRVEAW